MMHMIIKVAHAPIFKKKRSQYGIQLNKTKQKTDTLTGYKLGV